MKLALKRMKLEDLVHAYIDSEHSKTMMALTQQQLGDGEL